MSKRRYAVVGTGGRASMYVTAVTGDYSATSELVGLCDTNPGRMAFYNNEFLKDYPPVATYPAEDFDRMVETEKPDVVIVTTVDCYHDKYICRAMELGCDVITEKPMTIDAEKCQRIVDTARRTGREPRVTFNYRYSPPRSQVKELLMQGVVGDIISVDFHWLLNTKHGADYFRRWHRNKKNSGGLLVHKATHHFDLVNWWISSSPVEVYCTGDLRFYKEATAQRLGLQGHAERCLECPVADKCPFMLDLRGNKLYLENEHHDGYFRDRCVFSEQIDIEDTMALTASYRNGVRLSYSLNAFMPWEGYTIAFNGTKGRLEHKTCESAYVSGDGSVPGETIQKGTYIEIQPLREQPYRVEVRTAKGGHGGGDPVLLEDLFGESPPDDPLGRPAAMADGAWSILTGVAANRSIATGAPVRVDQLVEGLPGK